METFFSFGSRAIALVLLVQLGFLSPLAPVFAQEAAEPVVAPLETTVETPVVTEPTEPTEAALVTPPAPTTEESEKTPVTITEPATLTVPAEEVATSPEVSSSAPAAVEGEKIGGEEASALAPERQDENKQEIITSEKPKPLTYTAMTRELRAARAGKKEKNQEMMTQLERFIEAEKERLEKLPVGEDKRDAYLDLLESQARMLRGEKEKQSEGVVEKLKNVFADEEKKPGMTDGKTVQLLDKPAKFGFSSDEVTVQHFGSEMFKKKEKDTAFNFLSNPFAAVPALAHGSVLPTLEDTRADNGEVTITPEIRDIAEALGNNPTNILNFVRNTVSYEPYYGAKKGSVGCLQELVCNDVDTSSLLVALLRAAGVPARYKKSVAVLSAEQVRQLVGVQETRTAFGAFAWNKIPIYTLQSANAGKKLDEADFSIENQLAMEWVFVEAFYDYDERAGNHNNMLSFEGVTSTAAMQAELGQYPNKQWVLLDAVVKPYTHTSKEVVGDTAQFNTESFWYDYLRYQGPNSPLEKYRQDLIARTGKDIATVNFQSTKAAVRSALPYLPPKLPYYTGTGDVGGSLIVPEAWSVLPANRRQQVTVSLIKESDRGVVISHTFFGSEINNVEMSLFYDGATESDSQIIESYGGIAYTPAALVSIVPVLEMAGATYGPGSALTIGDQLIMQFDYGSNGQVIYSDQKFSTAGNQEGVYVSLSKVTDEPDADTKEKIVLQGNAAIARAYLKHVEDAGRTLKQALDYEYNVGFARSVVTQNRVLGKVDGVPTTFEFQGLTIDAGTYINDYSNVGHYTTHRKDFRLLWGLEASYYEGQIFTDLASLEAISTVKGLQYAYANPGTYTVQTISSATPNYAQVIDALSLTPNTEANILADVEKGNTVVTPDTFVEKGTWRGILYISLDPEWTGTYAIGEQVANGGWTSGDLLVMAYCDQICRDTYYLTNDGVRFLYEDQYVDSVRCSISEQVYQDIVDNKNVPANGYGYEFWKKEYGEPCYTATKRFGTINHTFILSTNASKFYSPDLYNYWVKRDEAKKRITTTYPNHSFKTFKFNLVAGTYSYYGNGATVYYQPLRPSSIGTSLWSDAGKAWMVKGAILSKLEERSYKPELYWCAEDDSYCSVMAYKAGFVLNKIGYPVDTERAAATSYPFGTEGVYQAFVGGQVYYETTWVNHAYYVPGYIEKELNSSGRCQTMDGTYQCGSGGTFGFPISDPQYNSQRDMIFQDFENGTRVKEFLSEPAGQNITTEENVQTIAIIRNYTDPAYRDDLIEGIMDSFYEMDVYGVGVNFAAGLSAPFVINEFKGFIVKKLGKTAVAKVGLRFVPGVGWVYSGLTLTLSVNQNWPLYKACDTDPDLGTIDGKAPAYYCGKLGVNAAAFGLGSVANSGASKIINKLGATSNIAKTGKSKLVNATANDDDWISLKSNLTNFPKTRTAFLETVYRLDASDIQELSARSGIQLRLLQQTSLNQLATFNGFVKSGSFVGAAKYRPDPFYKSEFYLYTKENAFSLPKLITDGISKKGFFKASELDDAITIYKNNKLGDVVNGVPKGEIVFVKKTDGTTVISPRYTDTRYPLPHPYLAGGEDVIAAGVITPNVHNATEITISNSTGHYKVHKDDMAVIITELESLGYMVKNISF